MKKQKLIGINSHDFNIIMQHLLPTTIRIVFPDKVTDVLIELSSFYRHLCAKNLGH